MEAFLAALLPADRTFAVHPFQGKSDLMGKLQDRLHGYANWLPEDRRIVVVVDRDGDDCLKLKAQLEAMARQARLRTRSIKGRQPWQLVNRIAVEELEAWYFGDWPAVCTMYPRVRANVVRKAGYRDPDGIVGGTWEAFERVLRKHGYFEGGLGKIEAARALGAAIDPQCNLSTSFGHFRTAVLEAVA